GEDDALARPTFMVCRPMTAAAVISRGQGSISSATADASVGGASGVRESPMERAYLDYNATAPLRPEARAALMKALEAFGNPSSVHAEGRAARALIEEARGVVAALVGAEAKLVTFVGGGTEANN